MKLTTAFVSLFLVAVSAVIVLMVVSRQGHSAVSAATSSESAALKDALKNGLITEDEYDAKLEAMAAVDPQLEPHTAGTPASISTRLKTVEIQEPAGSIAASCMQIPESGQKSNPHDQRPQARSAPVPPQCFDPVGKRRPSAAPNF
jgi:hypothetical protein